jgi:hypothetical protein
MKKTAENEILMIRLINLFADAFPGQAILKGGMELRLLQCPRHTNDLDYIFIPYTSKIDIGREVLAVLDKEQGLSVEHSMHSTCMRIIVTAGTTRVQIELNVARECKSQAISTSDVARLYHIQGRIIRVMSLDVALAHKHAAWLERDLMRDLYDVYYMRELLGISPDLGTIMVRLAKIRYQKAGNKGQKSMSLQEFSKCLRERALQLHADTVLNELADLLDESELPGLDLKIRKAMIGIAEYFDKEQKV